MAGGWTICCLPIFKQHAGAVSNAVSPEAATEEWLVVTIVGNQMSRWVEGVLRRAAKRVPLRRCHNIRQELSRIDEGVGNSECQNNTHGRAEKQEGGKAQRFLRCQRAAERQALGK
jgi:hypothetical protein